MRETGKLFLHLRPPLRETGDRDLSERGGGMREGKGWTLHQGQGTGEDTLRANMTPSMTPSRG